MNKITQEQLIERLKGLKEIKPREQWVILAKSRILNTRTEQASLQSRNWNNIVRFLINQRKLAYSFVTLSLIVLGLMGLVQYTAPGDLLFPLKNPSEKSSAGLSELNDAGEKILALSNKIKEAVREKKEEARIGKSLSLEDISREASQIVKELKQGQTVENREALKEMAESLQVLAYVGGSEVEEDSDLKDLYQTIVENEIKNLEMIGLEGEKAEELEEVKELYEAGKYVQALEKVRMLETELEEGIKENK